LWNTYGDTNSYGDGNCHANSYGDTDGDTDRYT